MTATTGGSDPYAAAQVVQTSGSRNGLGTAALVLGIIAVVTCWTVIGGVVLGVLAVIFGVIGKGRANRGEATNGGPAVAGLILGVIGVVLAIVLVVVGVTFVHHHKKAFDNLASCDKHATTQAQKNKCSKEFSNSINGSS